MGYLFYNSLQYLFNTRGSGQQLTLVRSADCTSLFLLPAYIICCSGLQPGGVQKRSHTQLLQRNRRPVNTALLTHRTGEDEAERVRHASITVGQFITVHDIRAAESKNTLLYITPRLLQAFTLRVYNYTIYVQLSQRTHYCILHRDYYRPLLLEYITTRYTCS